MGQDMRSSGVDLGCDESFELRCPSLQILQESQKFARARKRGQGGRDEQKGHGN